MSDENNELRQKVLSGAILSFFIPIYGYYATYLYEKGYCEQFNISSYLIEIGLSDVLKTIGIVIPVIIYIYLSIEIFASARTSVNPIIRGMGRIVWYIFIFAILILIGGWSNIILIAALVLIGIEIYLEFLLPLFRGFKGYKGRIEHLQETRKNKKDLIDIILEKIIEQIGGFTYTILFILIFSLIFMSPTGGNHAKIETSFLVIKSKPELVILRKYGQNFICTTFDRNKKEIKKNFYIKNIDQVAKEGLEIIIEDIGPLKVATETVERKAKKK